MEMYETEEEQIAALKRWWATNGTSIMIGAALGIGLILGWNYWKDYTQDRTSSASAMYEELLGAINGGKQESADKIAERLSAEYGNTSYANMSRLLQAKTKVQAGDLQAARALLLQVVAEAGSEMANVARIRVVRLMLATGEYEQGLQLIAEVDQASTESFAGQYDELTGDLYLALDRKGEARTAYQKALRSGYSSPLLQFKIDDLTAPELQESLK